MILPHLYLHAAWAYVLNVLPFVDFVLPSGVPTRCQRSIYSELLMTEWKVENSEDISHRTTGAFVIVLHPEFVLAHACPYRSPLYSALDNIIRRVRNCVAWGRPHFTCEYLLRSTAR